MSLKELLIGGVALVGVSFSCLAGTFTVTNTLDSGAGSLRQAISDANGTSGANLITFNIPGSGVQTISISSSLPTITNSIAIDGTTQPGYAGIPLVDVNGNAGFGQNGLIINASNCVVRALILRHFGSSSSSGVASGIVLSNAFGATIQGCYIGTTAAGTGSSGNTLDGILVNNSAANIIGGTNASQRNIISGNFVNGVFIFGPGSTGNQVMGNYIGLDPTGLVVVLNGQNGILISNAANNVVGGSVTGVGNVISGNHSDNLIIQGSNATGNVVAGNIIGLKANFSVVTASPGFNNDIRVDNAPSNTIGGTTVAARNYLGNNSAGILIINSNAVGNVIEGNYVGVSSNGSTVLPNSKGIYLSSRASGTIVGAPGAGNLISGNGYGLDLNSSSSNTVQANFIGTDATGMLALGNGGSGSGAGMVVTGSGNLIGGTVPGAGNVISGNPSDGLDIVIGSTADSVNNLVQGNFIGVAADGVTPLGNGLVGIGGRGLSVLGADSNVIGGSIVGAANTGAVNIIANNGLDGVWLAGTFGAFGAFGSNNLVLGNIVYSNGIVGANNGSNPAGVTTLGPNVILQNSIYGNSRLGIGYGGNASETMNIAGQPHHFPIITNATSDGVTTTVSGVLTNDSPNKNFRIEIFSNPAADPSGFGQGKTFLGFTNIVTDGIGNASFAATFPVGSPTDNVVSATSTDPPNPVAGYYYTTVYGPGKAITGYVTNPCPTIIFTLSGSSGNGQTTFNVNVGDSFSYYAYVSGGTYPYRSSHSDPPPGVTSSDNQGTGEIGFSGNFTTSGAYQLTLTTIDNNGCPGSITITFNITDPFLPLPLLSQANHPFAENKLDPISTYTGELHDILPPDLRLGGPMALFFQRYYAAFLKKDGLIAGALGDNWLHNFEMKLAVTSSNTVNVVNNLGRFIQFTNISGAFVLASQPDVPFQLSTNGSNYILGDPRSQRLYTFDSSGKLITIADGHGNAQTLSYAGSQLASVTDGLGRTLTFEYNGSGFLTNVLDGTRSVGFVQTGNNLTSARDALGFVTTYTYDTGNPTPGLMSAATEPQGNVPYAQVFNASGQVISQTEAGTNTTTLAYSNLTTLVTDPARGTFGASVTPTWEAGELHR